jgi:hypothetical protein
MTSSETPVPSRQEPSGSRPVLPSGIEAGLVGGLAVIVVFFVRELLAGAPMQTPEMLGTLMFDGPEAARAAVTASGAAAAYNAVHFALWVLTGALGSVLMRQVEAARRNWYRPCLGVAVLILLSGLASMRAAAAGLTMLWILPGMLVGIAAMGAFLCWRYPLAARRIRELGSR